jgi:putative ABC transport system permease protein
VLQDLKNAIRLLLKNPAFTAVAVLVLALGIGANTAVFSLVNAMMFQPTPAEGPGIVGIYSRDRTRPNSYRAFSWPAYQAIRQGGEPFEAVMAHTMTMLGTTEGDSTRRSFASIVSESYFSTLGVRLAAGREFTRAEERPGSDERVVIVGHQYARKAGRAPDDVLGGTVRLNARDYTIVGVAPEGFAGTMALVAPEYWLPLGVYEKVTDDMFREDARDRLGEPGSRPLMLVGRLRGGLSEHAAQPMLTSLSTRFVESDPVENKNYDLSVQRLSRTSVSTSPQTDSPFAVLSGLLMGTAALVLLISCLNLANMLLARGTMRRKEIALRLALGSGRARIVRQLLTESLLLALLGSAAGLLLAVWGTKLLIASFAAVLPLVVTFDASPDLRVLLATMGFCVVSTVIAALGPAWRVTRPDVLPDLKEQPAEHGSGGRFSMRNALVVGQIALSLALLTAAGLFMRGAIKAAVADPGFPLEGGVIATIDPGMAGYDEPRGRAAVRSILQRVRSTPGVQSASLATLVPFGEFQEGRRVQKAGTPPAPEGQAETGVSATLTIIGADYFDALRLTMLRGRGFTPTEEESAAGPRVIVVDEPLSRQLFQAEDPIGRQVQFASLDTPDTAAYTIVGVVAGVRHDLFDKAPVPHVYLPFGQHYRTNVHLHVRVAGGEQADVAMLGTMRREIRAADDQVPVLQLRTLAQQRDNSILLWAVNTGARLFSVFGVVALLLAVIGVYGVKSYVVSRRTREIGIRMALGATPSNVLWLVLREGLTLTLAGLAFGLLIAWGVAKALSGMLYEVSALDPVVFTLAPLLLTGSAIAASYFPARRATRVLPLTALRSE